MNSKRDVMYNVDYTCNSVTLAKDNTAKTYLILSLFRLLPRSNSLVSLSTLKHPTDTSIPEGTGMTACGKKLNWPKDSAALSFVLTVHGAPI